MSDDSLWSDYENDPFGDAPPLTGEAYKEQLDDDVEDAMDALAFALFRTQRK